MNLYILWFQGFDKAPDVVKWCVHSWKRYNPTWNIVLLDDTNLHEYVDVKVDNSDIVRMLLLRNGGLWVDATVFCHKPLDDWLPAYTTSGFFAFTPMSTWFMYAEKGHPLIMQWCEETLHGRVPFEHNVAFQRAWDQVPKLSIPQIELFKTTGHKDIDSKRVPVYKLSYKCTFPPYDPRMNVYYLYSTL